MERHRAGIELLRERATLERGVITFDITDQLTEGYNKFIPYYLHPEATYNVGLSRVELPHEGFGGDESVDEGAGGGAGESGGDLRAVWRRRTCAGGRDQLCAGPEEDEARKAAAEIAAELAWRGRASKLRCSR